MFVGRLENFLHKHKMVNHYDIQGKLVTKTKEGFSSSISTIIGLGRRDAPERETFVESPFIPTTAQKFSHIAPTNWPRMSAQDVVGRVGWLSSGAASMCGSWVPNQYGGGSFEHVPCNRSDPAQRFSIAPNGTLVSMKDPSTCLSKAGERVLFGNCRDAEPMGSMVTDRGVVVTSRGRTDYDLDCLMETTNNPSAMLWDSCHGLAQNRAAFNPIKYTIDSSAPSGTYLTKCQGCSGGGRTVTCMYCSDGATVVPNVSLDRTECKMESDIWFSDGKLGCTADCSVIWNRNAPCTATGAACGPGAGVRTETPRVLVQPRTAGVVCNVQPRNVPCDVPCRATATTTAATTTAAASTVLPALLATPRIDCVNSYSECIPENGNCGPGTQLEKITTPASGGGVPCGPTQKSCTVPCAPGCRPEDFRADSCLPFEAGNGIPAGKYNMLLNTNPHAMQACGYQLVQPCSSSNVMLPVSGTNLCGRVLPHELNEYGAKYVLWTSNCDVNDPNQLFTIDGNKIKSKLGRVQEGYELCLYGGPEWNDGWAVKLGPCDSNDRTKYFGNTRNNKLISTLNNKCIYNINATGPWNIDYAVYGDCSSSQNPRSLSLSNIGVPCAVSEWSALGPCVGGQTSKTRTVTQNPLNGGTPCPPLTETLRCTDCKVSEWRDVGPCVNGKKQVDRTIIENPINNGTPCPPLTDTVDCADCKVSEWRDAGPCLNGKKPVVRTITQNPLNGGAPCPPLTDTVDCALPCTVSEWSAWGACVNGKKGRTRTVTQNPLNGGAPCPPLTEDIKCPVNCNGYFTRDGKRYNTKMEAIQGIPCNVNGVNTFTYQVSQRPLNGGKQCMYSDNEQIICKCSNGSCNK